MTRRLWLILCLALALCPVGHADEPAAFDEGVALEREGEWERAAACFGHAVGSDPENLEYRRRYWNAVANAASALEARGDAAEGDGDFDAAYHAYALAYVYDPTSEARVAKLKGIFPLLGLPGPEPPDCTPRYVWPSAGLSLIGERSLFDVSIEGGQLSSAIEALAGAAGLAVAYDPSFEDRELGRRFALRNVTRPKALELLLFTSKCIWVKTSLDTILVVPDTPENRARLDRPPERSPSTSDETRSRLDSNSAKQSGSLREQAPELAAGR